MVFGFSLNSMTCILVRALNGASDIQGRRPCENGSRGTRYAGNDETLEEAQKTRYLSGSVALPTAWL